MKLLKYILPLALCIGMMVGCTEDNDPVITTMTVTEYLTSDGGSVAKVDRYTYTDDRLTSHVTTQNFSIDESTGHAQNISHEVTFTYTGNEVTLNYSEGNTAVYTLNADGYASECTYRLANQTRTYRFTYADGYLTQVDESIDGTPSLSNTFEYKDGDLTSIATGANKIICTPDTTVNRELLPCPVFEDTYPLSLHIDAIYARLLGKSAQHFTGSSVPAVADPQEKTEYSYTKDNTGKIIKIDKKLTYTGTTVDQNGHVTESTTVVENSLYFKYE